MIVALSGELGVGKTTLVRGILRGLGWSGRVKSPSYALVEDYSLSSLYFYHFDFYRFEDADEWDATGFAEYFRPDSIAVIEWPERVAPRLPWIDVSAQLELDRAGRAFELSAATDAGDACLGEFVAAVL
jgi:tRNA threonylcarbamoyladenosine biosynthesis protein TsaE